MSSPSPDIAFHVSAVSTLMKFSLSVISIMKCVFAVVSEEVSAHPNHLGFLVCYLLRVIFP